VSGEETDGVRGVEVVGGFGVNLFGDKEEGELVMDEAEVVGVEIQDGWCGLKCATVDFVTQFGGEGQEGKWVCFDYGGFFVFGFGGVGGWVGRGMRCG